MSKLEHIPIVTIELLMLKIKSLIAEKEMMTAAANRELDVLGDWRYDYNEAQRQITIEIDTLIAEAENITADM